MLTVESNPVVVKRSFEVYYEQSFALLSRTSMEKVTFIISKVNGISCCGRNWVSEA